MAAFCMCACSASFSYSFYVHARALEFYHNAFVGCMYRRRMTQTSASCLDGRKSNNSHMLYGADVQ
jgi:hypothetical protein